MTVKELFDNAKDGTLTWEQFSEAMGEAKFVDLTEGNYVSKQKYDDEIGKRDTRITELSDTITTRDTDLATLKKTLDDAGDIEALKQASKGLADLQDKYDRETKQYQKQLAKQAYEFAVKEFASTKQFTSNAAKRDFTQAMIAKNLSLEDGVIIGANDFVTLYAKDNADAFATESKDGKPIFVSGPQPKPKEKMSLSEMMQMKNANPDAVIDF